jgi:hypothetical protein
MSNNFTETEKPQDKTGAPELRVQSLPPDDLLLFQIFFLAQDQSRDVEVIETDELDFGEIIQRLKNGESVFIKYKNSETFEPIQKIDEEREKKPWYFNRC